MTKKGLETSGSESAKPASLGSIGRRSTGSKFVDLIASAMKNKDIIKNSEGSRKNSSQFKKM